MRRRTVAFAREADRDLLAIYDWILASTSTDFALRFVERLRRHCEGFDIASERGTLLSRRPGLRKVGYQRRVTITFSVDDETVTILRFYWAGRDWESELGPGN